MSTYAGGSKAEPHEEVESGAGLAAGDVHAAAAVVQHSLTQVCTLLHNSWSYHKWGMAREGGKCVFWHLLTALNCQPSLISKVKIYVFYLPLGP